jgi:hypothetical protein
MEQLYDKFLDALRERYPYKPDRVRALMGILPLEKESVYRRLRKDVYFSAEEVMRIAGVWDISMDKIINANSGKTRTFQFRMIEFTNPGETDYALLESFNRNLEAVAGDPNGQAFEVLNSLPRGLYCRSENLERFFTMKWLCKCAAPDRVRPFCDIRIPERMRALDAELIRLEHSISEMHSIHDVHLIENLIRDIIYFRSIGMVTADESLLLRDDLLELIDYLEEVTRRGAFPDTGRRMHFYLSHTWVETECALYKCKTLNMSRIKILERNSLTSLDGAVFQRLMNMVESVKRSSVLMSGSNALQQAEFFSRQRKIIRTL